MKRNYVVIGCFFLLMLVGLISYIITPFKEYSEDENRYLTKMPGVTIDQIARGEFTRQLEDYALDQFAWRSPAISVKTLAEKVSGAIDSNGVYFAKNHALMLKKMPSEFDQARWDRNVKAIGSFAQSHADLPIAVMLVPTAAYVNQDQLPRFAQDYAQNKAMDDAADMLKEYENVTCLNVAEALRNHSGEELYYKTDHHWTVRGAYYGYEVFAAYCGLDDVTYQERQVSDSFYGTLYSKVLDRSVSPDHIMEYIPKQDVNITVSRRNGQDITDTLYDKDKLHIKDKYQYFLGGNDDEVTITSDNHNGKRLLVIKDSYANCFVPFIAGQFESIHLIDLRYFNESLSAYITDKNISQVLILYNTNNFDEDISVVKM